MNRFRRRQHRPNLMVLLAFSVGLGVVVTTTAQAGSAEKPVLQPMSFSQFSGLFNDGMERGLQISVNQPRRIQRVVSQAMGDRTPDSGRGLYLSVHMPW